MALVTVTADNTRVKDAENATGYSNIGGGQSGSSEPSFAYQGSNLYNRKVTSTSSGAGFYYDPTSDSGSAQNMTTGRKTLMVKQMCSDYNGLNAASGQRVRIGTGTSAYYTFITAGNFSLVPDLQSYPATGGLVVTAIDPNLWATYRDVNFSAGAGGSIDLSAITYFGYTWVFVASTAKSENCGSDAIDIGTGLYLVGGDGGDADATWKSFSAGDEGVVANRWGYARASQGSVLCLGKLRVGTNNDSTHVATGFTDTTSVVVWPDHMAAAGFSGAEIWLGNGASNFTDGALHISSGTIANIDSRADFEVVGSVASGLFSHSLRNFRNVTYTATCLVTGRINCQLLTQGGAEFDGAVIRTNSLTSVACLQDPSFSLTGIHDSDFIQAGAGHAYEIDTATTITLTNINHIGYGANGSDDAAIDVTAPSGTVTINISGGDTPTYKTAGATVVINNAKNFTFTLSPSITNYEWRLYSVTAIGSLAGSVELAGEELASQDNQAYAYNYTVDTPVAVQIIGKGNDTVESITYYTLSSSDQNVSITLQEDDNN